MTRNAQAAPARKRRQSAPEWLDGQRLADRRRALHLTQAQVAEAVGTTQNNLSHWEIGTWGCDLETVIKLADFLTCLPVALMHDEARVKFVAIGAGARAEPDAA